MFLFLWYSTAFSFNPKELSPASSLEGAYSQPAASQTNSPKVKGISTWPAPLLWPAYTILEPRDQNCGRTLLKNLLRYHFNSREVSWLLVGIETNTGQCWSGFTVRCTSDQPSVKWESQCTLFLELENSGSFIISFKGSVVVLRFEYTSLLLPFQ